MGDLLFTDIDDETQVGSLTKQDNFIPYVILSHEDSTADYIYECDSSCRSSSTDEPILLDLVEDDCREYEIFRLSFKKAGIHSLRFVIDRGSDKSVESGRMIAQVSPYNGEAMKLLESSSTNELVFDNVTLESEITVDINVIKESNVSHYITFYSDNDNNKRVCGQFRLIFPICACSNWDTIPSVIPVADFVGWDPKNRRKNVIKNGEVQKDEDGNIKTVPWQCLDYAKEQLKVRGYTVTGWDESYITGKNKKIYQIDIDSAKYTIKGLDTRKELNDGINYLKESLRAGIPVLVGINYHSAYPAGQGDKTTDHFVVIVGMGIDDNKIDKYFTYFDNATGDRQAGTDPNTKRLYYQCLEMKLTNTNLALYDVTQIRKSIKLKKK